MSKRDRPGLVDPHGEAALAALVTGNETLRFGVHQSIFKTDAEWKPKIRLVAPTTKTFGAETADTIPEQMRVECIPVKGAVDRVCALDWPRDRLPAPKLLIDFPKRHLGQKEAFMQITRGKTPETLNAVVYSDAGARTELSLTGVKEVVIDRLLSPLATERITKPLPELPGELPIDLQSAVADFWQTHMRCHVISTVCAPADATRPLAFESIKVAREGTRAPERLVLRATLHGSSLRCACKLHGLAPMQERYPSERFEGSEVDLTLQMCGRKRPRTESGYGDCPLHGGTTPNVTMFPHICCHGTVATLGCSHFVAAGKQKRSRRKSGLWVPDLGLDGFNLLHAQGLLEAASMSADKIGSMLGKRPRDEIEAMCNEAESNIQKTVDEITRRRVVEEPVRSDAEMIKLDMAAVDALRAGTYRRHLTSNKEEVLAVDLPEGGTAKCTKADADKGKGPPLELAQTHIGLFRPPLPRGRR